jgi:hypothetical protein
LRSGILPGVADTETRDRVREHPDREDLAQATLEALETSGLDLSTLRVTDLAPLDKSHAGGIDFTRRLARLAGLAPLEEIARAARRNEAERRTIMVHAAFEAIAADRVA